jgi:hypothetical protein
MSWIRWADLSEERTAKVREFAQIMTIACLLFAGWGLWREREGALWLLIGGFWIFAAGVFAPRVLSPFERAWMWFGAKLSMVATPIAMGIIYFFVITPMALVLRLMRKDILSLRFEPEKGSYWVPVEVEGPGTRPYQPF